MPRVAMAMLLSAVVLAPARANVSVREKRDLDFGLVAAGQTTGVVRLAPDGTASCGPHTCLGGQRAAEFRLKGVKRGVYDVSYSSGDVLVHASGSPSIPFGNFTDDVGGTLILNAGGQGRMRVGGDLTIGPLTTGGDYQGSYTILFNLQ